MARARKEQVHARVRLHAWLEVKGVSQKEFADQLGVNRMTVGRWLDGSHPPSLDMVKAIQNATGRFVSANDWMVEGDIQAVA